MTENIANTERPRAAAALSSPPAVKLEPIPDAQVEKWRERLILARCLRHGRRGVNARRLPAGSAPAARTDPTGSVVQQ